MCPQWSHPAAHEVHLAAHKVAAEDPHALAMEVLRIMRALLEGFPLDWQLKIVKALTVRILLVVAAQQ
jgi:hypothetical protein